MVDILVSGQGQVTLVQVQGRVDSMTANQLGEALTKELSLIHI